MLLFALNVLGRVYPEHRDSGCSHNPRLSVLLCSILSHGVALHLDAVCVPHAERDSEIGLKLFGFIPKPVFAFIREPLRDHPRMPFGFTPESR
jgi:hypothetical protein